MGILSNLFGQNDAFYVRDFRNAYHLRPDVNPPRQKFQGYVNFVLNREIFEVLYPGAGGQIPDNTEFRTKISSLVRKFSLPEIDFKTEVKNQYNRKRIVNTGLEYTPVNITVMDTVGNEWYTLLMRYYAFYYMNGRNKNETGNRDTTAGIPKSSQLMEASQFGKADDSKQTSYSFDSNAYGFNVNNVPNFFERIDMVLYHGNQGVQYSLMNPMLTALKTGDVDYSDSNILEFELTFEYENFVPYYENNFGLTAFDLNRFEPADSYTGDAFSTDGKPLETLAPQSMAAVGLMGQPADRSAQDQIAAPQSLDNPGEKTGTNNKTVSADGQATASQAGTKLVKDPASTAVQSAGNQDVASTSKAAQGQQVLDTVTVTGYAQSAALPGIYGEAATFSNQADLTKSNLWGEIFKGTVNNGLVAAINGGSVKDAVINTLVGGVVAQGDAWALNLRGTSNTPATNTAPTPTRPAPPPPATSASVSEPAPVRPGTGP